MPLEKNAYSPAGGAAPLGAAAPARGFSRGTSIPSLLLRGMYVKPAKTHPALAVVWRGLCCKLKAVSYPYAYGLAVSGDGCGGNAYRQSRAGGHGLGGLDNTPPSCARVVRHHDGREAGLEHSHAPHHHHYARALFIRPERAPFLGDDARCPGLCGRGILPGALGRAHPLDILLVYPKNPLNFYTTTRRRCAGTWTSIS